MSITFPSERKRKRVARWLVILVVAAAFVFSAATLLAPPASAPPPSAGAASAPSQNISALDSEKLKNLQEVKPSPVPAPQQGRINPFSPYRPAAAPAPSSAVVSPKP